MSGTSLVPWLFRWRKRRAVFALTTLLLAVVIMLHLLRNIGWLHAADHVEVQTIHVKEQLDMTREVTSSSIARASATSTKCSWKNCSTLVAAVASTLKFVGVSAKNQTNTSSASIEPSLQVSVSADSDHMDTGNNCSWANFTMTGPPYFLTVVFIVRIYENDKSEMTTAEIKQWLVYLRYAGVEHVYLYDLWYLPGESQREALDVFEREGYLTYIDWHKYNPYVREKSQLPAYQHCIDNFGKDCTWQAAIDIDEYPFSPNDTDPGFMHRFVKKYSEQHSDVSEITMQNYLYLGEKNKSKELLMERLWRHTHGPSNHLVKPIYKPPDIKRAQVHHNSRRNGRSKNAPSNELRINHYWGARLQDWGPDTEEILAKTEEDRGMQQIVAAFKKCEQYIRHYS